MNEKQSRTALNRRQFLKQGAITAIGVSLASPLGELAAYAKGGKGGPPKGGGGSTNPNSSNKVVVILNLFGGNDFLNTVIPLNQYTRYAQLRPTIGVPLANVLTLNGTSEYGFNPGMSGLRNLYNQGRVGVICGVGAPQNTHGLFDHEESQALFETGQTDLFGASARTGWVGRWLDSIGEGAVSSGINMGGGDTILAGTTKTPLALNSSGTLALRISTDGTRRRDFYNRVMAISQAENPVAEYNRSERQRALAQASLISAGISGYTPTVPYPTGNGLSTPLRTTAALINANLGIRAIGVGFGGFDTHSDQNIVDTGETLGYHARRWQTISDALAAFQADLEGHNQGTQVLTLVHSEFGRRAAENSDLGTDHGYAGGMLAIGQTVTGGIHGQYPGLNQSDLVLNGNVAVTTDFRSVYSTVIANHFASDPVPVLGGSYPLLNFV